jgi:cytoskeletal protein CcmA (bactofilin family)
LASGSCSFSRSYRLIVEGISTQNCATVRACLSMRAVFKGESATENADIHGSFEGDVVVRKRLLLHATGRIPATITYGEIEIERGGNISGVIQAFRHSGLETTRNPQCGTSRAGESTRYERTCPEIGACPSPSRARNRGERVRGSARSKHPRHLNRARLCAQAYQNPERPAKNEAG